MMDDGPPLARPLLMPGEQIPQQQQTSNSGTSYSVPGVLHFVKNEFVRFEKERANWEVERAELQAKISFLQGERKGHDNLMRDLVRRIKMLEYALKQERLKLLKLQHPNKDIMFSDMSSPQFGGQDVVETNIPTVCNQQQSRRILRDYLREVGFPDNVLEARVARIHLYRTLTNPKDDNAPSDTMSNDNKISVNSGHVSDEGTFHNNSDQSLGNKENTSNNVEAMLEDDFRFLDNEDEDSDDDSDDEWSGGNTSVDTKNLFRSLDSDNNLEGNSGSGLDMETESAMDEWGSSFNQDSSVKSLDEKEEGWNADFSRQVNIYKDRKRKNTKLSTRPTRSELEMLKNQTNEISSSNSVSSDLGIGIMRLPGKNRAETDIVRSPTSARRTPHENIEVSLGIDDLAGLLISNEATTGYETQTMDSVKKWDHRFTLRSHFDVVTDVCFHPYESILISASEDCTLKLWNIQKASAQQSRRSAIIDVEPMYTFRGHSSPVLSVALSNEGDIVYSGAKDGSIRIWQLPADLTDPFDVYDAEINRGYLNGHNDSVWNMVIDPSTGLLATCGADGLCSLWDPLKSTPKLQDLYSNDDSGSPTSVDFVRAGINQIVVSYDNARTLLYDTETAKCVLCLDSAVTYDGTNHTQINKVIAHPTLPIIITAHEDKYIRFFDVKSGNVIHSMTAHMDAVTGLAIDPHGLYLLSGSHDGSLRFWSMDSKTCVQEITAHRKRYDESIYGVACHNTKPYFTSAGADGIAKVFT